MRKAKRAKWRSRKDKSFDHIVFEPAILQKSGKYQLSIQVENKERKPCCLLGVISDTQSKKMYESAEKESIWLSSIYEW